MNSNVKPYDNLSFYNLRFNGGSEQQLVTATSPTRSSFELTLKRAYEDFDVVSTDKLNFT